MFKIRSYAGYRAWIAVALFLLATAALSVRQYAHLPSLNDPQQKDWAMADFRDVVYYPARAFLDGRNPYDTDAYMREYPVGNVFPLYTPHLLLVSAPLAMLPYHVSLLIYWVIGVAAYPVFAACCLWACQIAATIPRTFFLAAALIASVPGRWNFDTGQLAVLLAIACILALHFAPSRPLLSSLALALSCVKPTFGIPLAMVMLANGRVRVVLVAGAIVAVASAAVLIAMVAAPRHLPSSADGALSDSSSLFRDVLVENQEFVDADSLVDPHKTHTRIDGVVLLIQGFGAPATRWVELAWFAACMGVCGWLLCRGGVAAGAATPAAGLMLLATVVSVYHQTYDAVLLAPLLIWLLRDCFALDNRSPRVGKFVVAGLVAIPFINIIWSKIFLGLLQNSLDTANDTIEALSRSAGLVNSVACLAALVGVAWLYVSLEKPEPSVRFRVPRSYP
jgi:hypothetical protein